MEWTTFDFKGGRTRSGRKKAEILEGDKFKCSLCVGTGVLPRTKGTKCPVCKGGGSVSLTGPAVACAYCRGRGDYPPRTNLTCTVCGGKGLVSIHKPIEVCGYCEGTGRARGDKLPCLKCKGKGVVTNLRGIKNA
jgi:DnaJ-class molecular chaperone